MYLLKGYKCDFFRYNTVSGTWESLPNAPAGGKPKWDKGSWLVYHRAHTLYAHKAKYGEVWTFDLTTLQWGTAALPGIPIPSSKTGKNKKSKDGGCAAYYNGAIYAFKGGNTCEFWKYDIATNIWTELDTISSVGSTGMRKRVKAGGDITCANGVFYALKGGKTQEFWRYVPGPGGGADALGLASVTGQSPQKGQDKFEEAISEGIYAYRPRWRLNGTAISYFKEVDGNNQIFMAKYGPPLIEVQLTFTPTDCENPVFSPDGNWIAFQMLDTLTDCYQIAKVQTQVPPSPIIPLTFDAYDYENPEWSLDGNRIVYQKDDQSGWTHIWRVPANGGEEEQLTFGPYNTSGRAI